MTKERVRRCWPFMHKWSPWDETGRKERFWFVGFAGGGEYTKVEQNRRCDVCGSQQYRVIKQNVVTDL